MVNLKPEWAAVFTGIRNRVSIYNLSDISRSIFVIDSQALALDIYAYPSGFFDCQFQLSLHISSISFFALHPGSFSAFEE